MSKSLILSSYIKILFETVLNNGTSEIVDPQCAIGATDKDIIKAANGYDVTRIILFNTNTLRGRDVSEEIARAFSDPFDNFAPLWIKNLPNFDEAHAEEALTLRELTAHRRSFSHHSNYL